MKKLSLRAARKVAVITLAIMLSFVVALCFFPEKTVYLSGKESYSPYYSGSTDKNGVALMFNVYEGREVVDGILDVLKEKNAKATFFVGGCWADDNTEALKKIVAEGHLLANHGYFHKDGKKLDKAGNASEIENCHKVVEALTGEKMRYFAPPSGSYSVETLKAAESLGYKTIMWTLDTIDWRDNDENLIYERATKKATSGALVLMHPKKHTLQALPKIIKFYKEKGLDLKTVAELIEDDTNQNAR
ncbi:MAG TPA: polysaccharide deacetylase [Clostridiales bacterium]|nr:polysaccharide deacetylase [Clostridiales bacterium]